AAAGLVVLGAMRKSLEDPDANDIVLHLQRIRNEQNKVLLHRNHPSWKFRYDGKDNDHDKIVQIKKTRSNDSPGPVRITFQPKDVRFQDEPFLEVIDGN